MVSGSETTQVGVGAPWAFAMLALEGATGALAGTIIAMAPSMPSFAANEPSDRLEVIIVTAERREERPQDVPVSMTLFSGEKLSASVLQGTIDLQTRTPGLVFTTNAIDGQPYIRGVGTDIVNVGTDSSIAVQVDGVYQARPSGTIQDFLDIERVEILKGPQGT